MEISYADAVIDNENGRIRYDASPDMVRSFLKALTLEEQGKVHVIDGEFFRRWEVHEYLDRG